MAGQRSRSCGLRVISHLLTILLWGTLNVKCQQVQQAVPMSCPDGWKLLTPEMASGAFSCALASSSPLNMTAASRYCEKQGAVLGIPPSEHHRNQVKMHATTKGWDDVWINAVGGNRVWNWDLETGARRLQLQGCWKDDPNDRDLDTEVTVQTKSVENCTERCLSAGNLTASVQFTQSDDFMCRCGSTFGKHKRINLSDCSRRCPGAPSGSPFKSLCGATNKQTVFLLRRPTLATMGTQAPMDTLLSQAALELPYWDTRSIGECATIGGGSNVKWTQTDCHIRKPYICQYTMETCMLSSREEQMWLGGTCLTFHTDEPKTWFKARESCLNMGGRLLTLDGVPRDTLDSDMASELRRMTWWIGLSIYTWAQSDGNPLPAYNGWRAGEPQYREDLQNVCVHALETDDFEWSTSPCNVQKNFYCIKSAVFSPFPVLPATRPPLIPIGPVFTRVTVPPPMTRPPVTFIDSSTTESTPSPTGDPQEQGGLTPIFIGAIGAGIGVAFVLIVIGIWCCCRRCTSGSKDSSKDTDENGKPRRLPSIPGGGRGVHRIKGKTVRYLSDPALSLNHLPPEDVEDDGEYDYIEIALKKGGAGEEEGVKYQGLTDSMKKKKGLEILEMEYEDLYPHSGLPDDNYIIPMEPPKISDGIAPPVVEATNEKPPMGMSMPGKVPKTVEASLRIRDSNRDSKPEDVTKLKPTTDAKREEAVSRESRAEENINANAEPEEQPEYADLPPAEDSDDEDTSPQTPNDDDDDDDEVIPDKAEVNNTPEEDNKSDVDTPSDSVIEMEKAT